MRVLHVEVVFCSDNKFVKLSFYVLEALAKVVFEGVKVTKAIEIYVFWHVVLGEV